VLVAEDNEDHRFFIKRALDGVRSVDLDVVTVSDGEEALEYLQRRGRYSTETPRPHMVLLDLRMPRRNGLEVLEVVKADPELRKIPICVLSSSDRPEDIDEAYLRGTNSYVIKSSDLDGIRRELQNVSEYWTSTVTLPEPP
jgi:CheY-like chemotaxis protein